MRPGEFLEAKPFKSSGPIGLVGPTGLAAPGQLKPERMNGSRREGLKRPKRLKVNTRQVGLNGSRGAVGLNGSRQVGLNGSRNDGKATQELSLQRAWARTAQGTSATNT